MKTQQEIKQLFSSLSVTEQVELIKELSSSTNAGASVAEFAEWHKQQYGANIDFTVADHAPVVTAVLHAAYGSFTGKGSNKRAAKVAAVELALKDF